VATATRTFQGVTYTNGNCPKSILAPLDGDNWGNETAYLRKDAAASWNRARAEVKAKTGIVLTVRGWNRTIAEQEQFFFERYRPQATGDGPYGDVRWYKNVRYVRYGTAAAAIPGNSNHGWGLAVDVVDFGGVGQWTSPRYLAAWPILTKHGWTETEGRGSIQEPWHKVYDSTRDQHRNDPVQEDDMTPEESTRLKNVESGLKAAATDLDTILRILTEPLEDGNMMAPPRTMWRRAVAVPRRIDGRLVAREAVPIEVDVDASAVAEELLALLPKATAEAVVNTMHARLAQ